MVGVTRGQGLGAEMMHALPCTKVEDGSAKGSEVQ